MPETFNPAIQPSTLGNKPRVKILKAEFGDGYMQATRDGLNNVRRVLTLEWSVLTIEQAQAIETFLETHGGTTPFLWTPPNGTSPLKWTCAEWSMNYREADLRSVSAKFEQSFNP